MSDDKKKTVGGGLIRIGGPASPAKKGNLTGALSGRGKPSGLTKNFRVSGISDDTLSQLRKSGASRNDRGYLGYVIDATGSRADTWNTAKSIQSEMFREIDQVGNLFARVMSFGGSAGNVNDLGWLNDAEKIVSEMDSVRCQVGQTNIYGTFQKMIEGEQDFLPDNVVMIGDCCEETDSIIIPLTRKLTERGIKVFAFHESTPQDRNNNNNGRRIYQHMAEATGGAFEVFGPRMPLKDLCTAVGVYTVGKEDALQTLMGKSEAAKRIGQQLLRLSDQRGSRGHRPK